MTAVRQKNMGVAKTRNKGIKLAKTKYVMFLDEDDYLDGDYIEKLMGKAERQEADVVLSGFRRTNEKGETITETRVTPGTEWAKMMVLTPWAKIMRTEFLREKKIKFLDNNIGEDIYFNLVMVFETEKIEALDYVGYNWFLNTESVSSTKQRNAKKVDIYRLMNACYDELKRRDLLDKNYEMIEAHFVRYAYWFLVYVGEGMKYGELKREYKKMFAWTRERFPGYRRNKLMSLKRPEGEKKENRRFNFLFKLAQKCGLGAQFAYLYSAYRRKSGKV